MHISKAQEFLHVYEALSHKQKLGIAVGALGTAGAAYLAHKHGYLGGKPSVDHHILRKIGLGLGAAGALGIGAGAYLSHQAGGAVDKYAQHNAQVGNILSQYSARDILKGTAGSLRDTQIDQHLTKYYGQK